MSAVGWIGLGNLGGPCSAALAGVGLHDVVGYDISDRTVPPGDDLVAVPRVPTIGDVVRHTDEIVYVAVQTPHAPKFGGELSISEDDVPVDFEYSYLKNAVRAVAREAALREKVITIVVVSTVLPGACNRHIRPLLNEWTNLVYHPFFIAQGTVVRDFTDPEFVLLGADHREDAERVLRLYTENMHTNPAHVVSVESAELAKVAYNTFITMKIVFANVMAEFCESTGADVDEVTGALALGHQRIVSPAYMTAGMGDGGACHPRDNIALSALAQQHGTSVNLMGFLIAAREMQTAWHASTIIHWLELTGFPVVLLGKTYKPSVASTAGSPALLLAELLDQRDVKFMHVDHLVDGIETLAQATHYDRPCVFFVATQHEIYADLDYPNGSVVIDPFGYVEVNDTVTLVTPGRKRAL